MRRRSLLAAALGAGALASVPMAAFLPQYIPFTSGSKRLNRGDTLTIDYHRVNGQVLRTTFEARRPAVYAGAFVDAAGHVVPVEVRA